MRMLQLMILLLVCFMVYLNLPILLLTHDKSNLLQQHIPQENQANAIMTPEVIMKERPYCKQPNGSIDSMISHINTTKIFVDVVPITGVDAWIKWVSIGHNQTKVLGFQRPKPGFMTIGIPSIKRKNGTPYLLKTISYLIDRSSVAEKKELIILVFLADFDHNYNKELVKNITDIYMDHINSGFIQIVQTTKDFYPRLTNLKQNFKDAENRVKWRSKLVADFSFMFLFAQNLSEYYIQIEDDVMPAQGFVPDIKDFITKNNKTTWAMLEFSELGFIGKLFKNEDLEKLATFLLTFYEEQPIDWLIDHFRGAMAQKKRIISNPTLFQHLGVISSFDTGKPNKIKDKKFKDINHNHTGHTLSPVVNNPPAQIVTNMTVAMPNRNNPRHAYTRKGYFWARDVKMGDAYFIIFEHKMTLKRVVIETGHVKHPGDIIKTGVVESSPRLLHMGTDHAVCQHWQTLGTFENGNLDVDDIHGSIIKDGTKCLKISIGNNQTEWVIINDIVVYPAGTVTKQLRFKN